jgi:hypothetical protein
MDQPPFPVDRRDDGSLPGASPEYFPIRLAPEANTLTLVPMSEQLYRGVNFLDDREIPMAGSRDVPLDVAIRELDAKNLPPRPLHWIFHVAFCGSTLVSRCLERLPTAFVLKEPFAIHDMAARKRHRDDDPATAIGWHDSLRLLIALLGRTYRDEQVAIVKPTDASTHLMADVLALNAGSKALFQYVGVEEFLLAMLGDRVRMGFVRERLQDLAVLFPDEAAFRRDAWQSLPDASQATCLWVLHLRLYAKFAGSTHGGRCRSLDFAGFLRDPRESLAAIARFFGLGCSSRDIEAAIAMSMAVHSKETRTAFSTADRVARLKSAAETHRREIDASLAWARREFPDFDALQAPPNALPGP